MRTVKSQVRMAGEFEVNPGDHECSVQLHSGAVIVLEHMTEDPL